MSLYDRCPTFNNLDAACTLIEDPNDPCCKIPSCTPGVALTNVPVPSYGPGITGYGTAKYPPITVTGTTGPGTSGSGTPTSFTNNGQTGPTVNGTTSELYILFAFLHVKINRQYFQIIRMLSCCRTLLISLFGVSHVFNKCPIKSTVLMAETFIEIFTICKKHTMKTFLFRSIILY
jgi:hypothetical protein